MSRNFSTIKLLISTGTIKAKHIKIVIIVDSLMISPQNKNILTTILVKNKTRIRNVDIIKSVFILIFSRWFNITF